MDGREHGGVLWLVTSRGAAPDESWDHGYRQERLPALRQLGRVGAAVRLRPADGFELPAGGSHAVVLETVGDDVQAAAAELRGLGPGPGIEECLAYRFLSRTGSAEGRSTRGVVAVFTDCSDPAAEDDFNAWYEFHAREVVEQLGHHAVTRYRSSEPDDRFARYLAIYETESDDPGQVQRDGMAWYFESGHVDEFPTPTTLVARAEIALERDS